jgi:hypothetical protein
VTGIKVFDAVYSDRSPASLAVIRDGAWVFLNRQQALRTGEVRHGS